MPPYGNAGGRTNKSYTPNWYGIKIFSSSAKNLYNMYIKHADSADVSIKAKESEQVNEILLGCVLPELPFCSIDKFFFGPHAARPLLTFWNLKGLVTHIARRDRNEIWWNSDGLCFQAWINAQWTEDEYWKMSTHLPVNICYLFLSNFLSVMWKASRWWRNTDCRHQYRENSSDAGIVSLLVP